MGRQQALERYVNTPIAGTVALAKLDETMEDLHLDLDDLWTRRCR